MAPRRFSHEPRSPHVFRAGGASGPQPKRVTRVNPTDGSRTVAVTIDEVYQTLGQDGLLGLALHPDLLKSKGTNYVYVAYTYNADPGSSVDLRMKVRRYTYEPLTHLLSSPVDILAGLPHGTDHGGGRMVFGSDGKLYLSRGDQGSNFLANYCNPNHAQDLPTAAQVQVADWSLYQGKCRTAMTCGHWAMRRWPSLLTDSACTS
jgi:glucose/arabinose dehydrogenase